MCIMIPELIEGWMFCETKYWKRERPMYEMTKLHPSLLDRCIATYDPKTIHSTVILE
jgi:hypothetical protein